ncbi:hypothetical protein [Terriglobus sp. TAA 43]|uniref:hypothetical protein n=1 Tax=Terriglobus sp. TAA 43 TaxID=278961 RepID=UPI0006485821|nr:hypothetical protein [Terriglobus sp. TAA 43]
MPPIDNRFGQQAAVIERSRHYLQVREDSDFVTLASENYGLLQALLGRLGSTLHESFFEAIAARLGDTEAFGRRNVPVLRAGFSDACTSETPLIAEFLVRNHQASLLVSAISQMPFTPALTLLLLHLLRMIAFNFRVLNEQELNDLGVVATDMPERLLSWSKGLKASRLNAPPLIINTDAHVLQEIPSIAGAVAEECREAAFLYLKGALVDDVNLEVNQDKERVRTFLEDLGFSQTLIDSLDEVERLYRGAASQHDYKSSMGHLRSFLENLHIQACERLHVVYGGTSPSRWGETTNYLVDHKIITIKESQFVIPLFTLLSDEAIHPLQTTRVHARLLRNICIEWGLLLLTKMNTLNANLSRTP